MCSSLIRVVVPTVLCFSLVLNDGGKGAVQAAAIMDVDGIFEDLFFLHGGASFGTAGDPAITESLPSYTISNSGLTGNHPTNFQSNTHAFWFSSDGGSTPRLNQEDEAFDVTFDLTITTAFPEVRKSIGFAGEKLNDPNFGGTLRPQFVTRTNADGPGGQEWLEDAPGNTASFGAPFPNVSYDSQYVSGDTVRMRIIYVPPTRDESSDLTETGTFEFVIDKLDDALPAFYSGEIDAKENPADIADLPGIPANTKLGFRAQIFGSSDAPNDSYAITIENILFQDPTNSGDFDRDTDVDGADFLAWQRGFGITNGTEGPLADIFRDGARSRDGDGNGDRNVDASDLVIWQSQFGAGSTASAAISGARVVPEPASGVLVLLALQTLVGGRLRYFRRLRLS